MENCEIKIDGYSVFVDHLNQMDANTRMHDAGSDKVIEWTTEQLKRAMVPLTSLMNSLRDATRANIPDEMELSLQLEVALKGETPIFKIVSTESKAQVALKFVWKNKDN